PGKLGHPGDRIEDQDSAAAQDTQVIIEGVLLFALAELEFFGPIEFMRLLLIPRRSRPTDQLNGRVALLYSFSAGLMGPLLHLFEQLGVVDFFRVIIFDITVFLIIDDHTPGLRIEWAKTCRNNCP